MKKSIILMMLTMLMFFTISLFDVRIKGEINESDWVIDLGRFRENTYQRKLDSWLDKYPKYSGEDINVLANEILSDNSLYDENKEAILIKKKEEISFNVLVPEEGLYHFSLNFLINEEFTTAPTIKLSVNDEVLYNELNNLNLPIVWNVIEREEENKYNRYGNELLPYTAAKQGEYYQLISDPEARYEEPLWLKLNSGVNKITIQANNYDFYLKGMTFSKEEQPLTYQEYYNIHKNEKIINDQIVIKGYLFEDKNDVEIKSGYYKGAQMEKASYKTNVLNKLEGDSISRSGSKVSYLFEVKESGLYQLSFKYLQQAKIGMSSGLSIFIDDEIPFREAAGYLFSYNKKWEYETLHNKNGQFLFFLEKGEHKLTLETTVVNLTNHIDELYRIMDRINSLGLAVSSITGRSEDALIDWDILKYLPNIKEELILLAERLEDVYDLINNLTPKYKKATNATPLLIASKQLKRLAKNPNKIPNKLAEFNQGSGSAYQLIGVAINDISGQTIDIENIYFHGSNIKLPKANGNFFERIWFSIKSFFYSFIDERYKLSSSKEKNTLNVWVGKSSLYLDIMQNMIDDEFTKETGIKVKLNVLPSNQKIILNNATKTNPDVVLSIDSWDPFQYALRGMLVDLKSFSDFDEVVEDIHPNNFTPMVFEDGVYGIPETQSTYLLYYRTDILEFLGITPPDTWDDVINILPILQSYQMNFYHPLGGEGAYKGFGLTSPIIYQMGGEIYQENGFSTTFDEEINIEAIKFMTDIFNVYDLPEQVPSFFEHFRSGSLPLGIATADFYLQLKYAAPELKGQWDILPLIGMYDENLAEVARWAPTYGKASILFKASEMQKEGFQLIKWWNKKATQLAYLQNVKMILGERYLYLPANLKTLEESIWDVEVKEQALIQAKWARIPAVTPGSYIVERELTNIWNKIVIDHINPREAIDQSIPRINRELRRKFEEFGYLKGGEVIREYKVPRNDNIENWIKKID